MIKFINPQNGRYYYISVQKDLFNDWLVIIFRGGWHHHVKHVVFSGSRMAISSKINELSKRRIARGYVLER